MIIYKYTYIFSSRNNNQNEFFINLNILYAEVFFSGIKISIVTNDHTTYIIDPKNKDLITLHHPTDRHDKTCLSKLLNKEYRSFHLKFRSSFVYTHACVLYYMHIIQILMSLR